MKKILITLAVALSMGITALAQTTTKVVTDSVAFMPSAVQIHQGVSKNGNPKYWIELPTESGVRKVSLTESHATSNRLLALIERRDSTTGRYTYSIKFAEPRKSSSGKADLSSLTSRK